MPPSKRPPKIQRWFDLLAALLRRNYPVSFDDLAQEVPQYADAAKKRESILRTFERDKDELRALGVPIEAVADELGNLTGYRLKSRAFYLPYLQIAAGGAPPAQPKRPKGIGYQSLPLLAFEPDELALVARAANRVQQMGHPSLAADAATAVRKLAFDVAVFDGDVREILMAPRRAEDPAVLDVVSAAVRRRKTVEFIYRSMASDTVARRTVEPYGLVFLSGHWYLIARDPLAEALRHFRVNRITEPMINAARAQSADFELPADFSIWEHTVSPQAWELGDDDAITARVRFTPVDVVAVAAAQLGQPDTESPEYRQFTVRRPDAFVRWLLSLAGSATPIAPESVVAAWRTMAAQTAALYTDAQ